MSHGELFSEHLQGRMERMGSARPAIQTIGNGSQRRLSLMYLNNLDKQPIPPGRTPNINYRHSQAPQESALASLLNKTRP